MNLDIKVMKNLSERGLDIEENLLIKALSPFNEENILWVSTYSDKSLDMLAK